VVHPAELAQWFIRLNWRSGSSGRAGAMVHPAELAQWFDRPN
jgi:hypothetical protein